MHFHAGAAGSDIPVPGSVDVGEIAVQVLKGDGVGSPVTGADRPVLLYDGLCGFCNWTVRSVLARKPDGPMRFAPLQGETAAAIRARHPELREIDSIILIEPGTERGTERVRVRSDAAIAITAYIGGPWHLARVLRFVPPFIRDAAYKAIAGARYRIFGRLDACRVHPPATRSPFLP